MQQQVTGERATQGNKLTNEVGKVKQAIRCTHRAQVRLPMQLCADVLLLRVGLVLAQGLCMHKSAAACLRGYTRERERV